MALSDLSLNQIQLFLRAAEFRSFTAAAACFHTSQSAVSKSIAGMESALGFPLFHRGRGQLTLTEPGQCLYERWQGLMGSLTAAVQEAELRCPEIEGTRTGMILVWKGKEPPDPLRQLIRAFPTAEEPPAL